MRGIAGSSGRHSARRAPAATAASVARGRWRSAGVVVLVARPVHVRGVAVAQRGEGGDARPAGCRESSSTATPAAVPGAVESIAATVPADIRATGRLVIGVNVPYAPNEFKDASGQIVGFDVDLMNAMARTLGLTPDYRETAFEAIIPSVRAGDFNVGMSSFTDTKEREESADFVTYFQAGTLWAQQAGGRSIRTTRAGCKVGVQYAALQETEEIPAKSDACVAAGQAPIDKVVYVSQDDLNEGVDRTAKSTRCRRIRR